MNALKKTLPADAVWDESAASMPLVRVLSPGDCLGDFEVMGTLGAGAFATVYLARQISLGRYVALKVSRESRREARTLAPLEHDHIVRVFSEESHAESGLRSIAMQYVAGITVERLIEAIRAGAVDPRAPISLSEVAARLAPEGPLSGATPTPGEKLPFAEACLELGAQMASALAFAHSRQVLHLDVKPANILISVGGRALLTDFNLATHRHADPAATSPFLGGTLQYMPPEQKEAIQSRHPTVEAKRIDARADIYALGRVLLELLGAAGYFETQAPHREEVRSLLRRATQPDPDLRYRTALEFCEALDGCLELHRLTRRLPPAGPLHSAAARRPLLTLTAGGAVLQLLASLMVATFNLFCIFSHLDKSQRLAFFRVLEVYIPVVSGISLAAWGAQLLPLARFLRDPVAAFERGAEIPRLRARVQRLLPWVTILTVGSWIPASFVLPLGIEHITHHPVPTEAWMRLLVSVFLSTLICLSYACLFAESVILRALYPRFWIGEREIQRVAGHELRTNFSRFRLSQGLAVGAPLLGVSLLILSGAQAMGVPEFGYRLLLVFVLGIGAGGQWLAIRLGYPWIETYYRFTRTAEAVPVAPAASAPTEPTV